MTLKKKKKKKKINKKTITRAFQSMIFLFSCFSIIV